MNGKNIFKIAALFLSTLAFSQVGINNTNPKATLDITEKKTDGSMAEGVIMVKITGDQLASADSMYNADQKGAVVYVTSPVSAPTSKTGNVTSEGYYFFDGTIWQKMNDGNTDYNVFKDDGTLTSNRVVDLSDKTMRFNSSPAAGTVGHFEVDGSSFSVNTLLNRVGIGTSAPSTILNVVNPGSDEVGALSIGHDNCGQPCGETPLRSLILYNSNSSNAIFSSLDFWPGDSPLSTISDRNFSTASILGIDRNSSNAYAGIYFSVKDAVTSGVAVRSSGNVGINVASSGGFPRTKLDVNGSGTNTVAFNAGNQMAIDFSKSNMAYTAANPGNFTLNNIKDGGVYTLVVQGSTSGISAFNASGFNVKYSNNGLTIDNTQTIYTFFVMGSVVYVNAVYGI